MFAVDDDRGMLCRGSTAVKQVPGQKPISSIPAKFETVLFKGAREKKGFGSEGRRFSTTETENPGPGSYNHAGSSVSRNNESIGVKGFGSMTSNSKRLSARAMYTGPGPGTYKQEVPAATKYSRAATMANFAEQTLVPSASDDNGIPGPGTYSAEDITKRGQKLDWEPPTSHKSAFKGTSHKLILGNMETPPPSKYTMPELWEPKPGTRPPGGTHAASYSRAGSSAFAGGGSGSSLAGMSSTMFLEDPKDAPKPDAGPGPGSYNLQYFSSIRSGLDRSSGKHSSSFQASDVVDRFGASLHHSEPDAVRAGSAAVNKQYTPHTVARISSPAKGVSARISSPAKGVSAPFISQSPGRSDYNMKEAGKAPGPAYYEPTKPDKRSFHLNVRKRLVP